MSLVKPLLVLKKKGAGYFLGWENYGSRRFPPWKPVWTDEKKLAWVLYPFGVKKVTEELAKLGVEVEAEPA